MPLQKASPPLATSSHPSSVTAGQKTPNTSKVRVKTSNPQEEQKWHKRVPLPWQNSSAFLVFPEEDSRQAAAERRGAQGDQPQDKHPAAGTEEPLP